MSSHPNWRALATVAFSYKPFVQESRPNNAAESVGRNTSYTNISGEECRKAYEEILAVPPSNTRGHDNVNLHSPKIPTAPVKSGQYLNKNQWVNTLMKEASVNNINGVKQLIGEERELNITDQFGWTMLMCAAHAGAIDVVKYLVENGANIKVKDKGGNTCISLAKRQKHYEILDLLKNLPESDKQNTKVSEEVNKIFCDACKQCFEETPRRLHKNSTVHLFNIHPHKNSTWYGIPDSNKGFKLMLKSGWDKELGLGPEGSGTKFPPKTILKRDRKGLGIHSGIARVTHFKPHDTCAVEAKKRCEAKERRGQKRSRKYQVSSERKKEQLLRRELNF